jgi:hypothetical protein
MNSVRPIRGHSSSQTRTQIFESVLGRSGGDNRDNQAQAKGE